MPRPRKPDYLQALQTPPDEQAVRLRKAVSRYDLDTVWPQIKERLPGGENNTSTVKNTLSSVKRLFAFAQEHEEPLLAPTPGFAQRYLASLEQLKPNSQKMIISRARTFYAILRDLGAIGANLDPFASIHLKSPPLTEGKEAYSEEEIERLIAHAPPEERLVVLLGSDAGLTTSEAAELTWQDVQLTGDTVNVRAREVLLSPRLAQALREASAPQGGPMFAQGPVLELGTNRVHSLRSRLFRLSKNANVDYRAWRALRHAYALKLWRATRDPGLVAEQLGFSTMVALRPYLELERQQR